MANCFLPQILIWRLIFQKTQTISIFTVLLGIHDGHYLANTNTINCQLQTSHSILNSVWWGTQHLENSGYHELTQMLHYADQIVRSRPKRKKKKVYFMYSMFLQGNNTHLKNHEHQQDAFPQLCSMQKEISLSFRHLNLIWSNIPCNSSIVKNLLTALFIYLMD